MEVSRMFKKYSKASKSFVSKFDFSCRRLAFLVTLWSIQTFFLSLGVAGYLCSSQCDRNQCRELERCPGSKVLDACSCCFECAKQVGESCGGSYSLEGTCEGGLLCVIKPPPNGGLITQDLPGVCAEIVKKPDHPSDPTCKDIVCDNHVLSHPHNGHKASPSACPLDSRELTLVDPSPPWMTLAEMCCNSFNKSICQCLPCPGVGSNTCGSKQLPIQVVVGTSTPGQCCDVYRCVEKEEFCKTIQCNDISSSSSSMPSKSSSSSSSSTPEEGDDVIGGSCPDDSTQLDPDSNFDVCCPTARRCQCKPVGTCPGSNLTCPPGKVKRLLSNAAGIPGSCCDVYDCRDVSSTSCTHDKRTYKDGEKWTSENCLKCQCDSGIVKCFKIRCPEFPVSCEWVGHQENGSCCPVCKGCSKNEKFYNNGATWEQDTCITCRCVDGQSYCQAIYCAAKCTNPRVVEGHCCPVCDEEDAPLTLAPHCRLPKNCDLLCKRGYARDSTGCPVCGCLGDDGDDEDSADNDIEEEYNGKTEEPCHPECSSPKYVLHPISGRKVCICNDAPLFPAGDWSTSKPTPSCGPLTDCSRQCLYGYKTDTSGCPRCRCNRCPQFRCSKKCPAGFRTNLDGCKICKCNDSGIFEPPILQAPSSHPNSASNKGRPCSSASGKRISDGQTWWDGCRRCFCRNGFEMCELVTCPPIKCTNPIIAPGSCCLTCPGVEPPKALMPNGPETCLSSDGRYFVDGETWSLDQCTLCICHLGNPLCTIEACPPVLCHHPVHQANSCCPVCPHFPDNHVSSFLPASTSRHHFRKPLSQKNRTCTSTGGMRSSHGDSWRLSPCQSCVCRDGQINCFSQTCPILGCNRTVLKKGHCCPTCLEKAVHFCTYDSLNYDNGESWMVDDCMTCACMDGHVLCTTSVCEPVTCPHPVFVQGKCCPECHDKSTTCSHEEHAHSFNTVSDTSHPANLTLIIVLTSVGVIFVIILAMFAWICVKLNKNGSHSSNGVLPLTSFYSRRYQLNDGTYSGVMSGQQQAQRTPVSPLFQGSRKQTDSTQKLRFSIGDPPYAGNYSACVSSLTTASLASSSLSSSATKKRLSSLDGLSSNDGKLSGKEAPKEADPVLPDLDVESDVPPPLPRRPPPSNGGFLADAGLDSDDLTFAFDRASPADERPDKLSELSHSSDISFNYDSVAVQPSANFFRKSKNHSGNIDKSEMTQHLLSSSPTKAQPISNRKSW